MILYMNTPFCMMISSVYNGPGCKPLLPMELTADAINEVFVARVHVISLVLMMVY